VINCDPLQGPIYAESGGSHDDRKVSGDLERRIDAEVLRIVREAYQRAVSILVSRDQGFELWICH
jgi:ATP-dependent Zn protease